MSQSVAVLNQVLPIVLLLGLGFVVRSIGLLSERAIDDLKTIVITLALPSVLFTTFSQVEFETAFIWLFVAFFLFCVLLLAGGLVLQKLFGLRPYFPFLMTGFEFGMIGVSLFGSAYGLDAVGYLAIADLGHEFFIWFAFAPLLLMKRDGAGSMGKVLKMFVTTPVIIGMCAGIALNLLGVGKELPDLPVMGAVWSAMKFLAGLTIPLILIIVGYGIKIERKGLGDVLLVVGLRTVVLVPLGWFLAQWFVGGILGLAAPYQAAFFTMLILPSPFIVPLFLPKELPDGRSIEDERRFVNNTLTLHTLTSIAVFFVYVAFNPTLGA
ncbi:MAG: hypothetical protein D6E12_17025 [Desulfovibrio sp.]|nr:MAG: hypothetical protein D6E12_17025 [Desulfovibrio sp.]